jgi:tetratricopeptide (TPR) repeat protein
MIKRRIILPQAILLISVLAIGVLATKPAVQNKVAEKNVQRRSSAAVKGKTRSQRVVSGAQPKATQKATANETSSVSDADSKTGEPTPTKTIDSDRKLPESAENSSTTTEQSSVLTHTKNVVTSLAERVAPAEVEPDRIRSQIKLAEELNAANKKNEAVELLRSIVETDTFDPQGFYNVGNALMRLGAPNDAIKAYRKAIDQRKGNYSRAWNNLGVVLFGLGRWDDAYDAFLSALRVENFYYAEASYNLGRLYAARGETDRAIREWRRALSVDAGHVRASSALAGAYHLIDIRRDGSRTTSPGAGESRDQNVSSSVRARDKGAFPFKAAYILSVDDETYGFLQRARSASERGQLPEAVQNYNRVILRSGGYFPPANLELAYVLIKLKRNDEALAAFQQVMNRDGYRYPVSYYHAARLYEHRGDLALAEEAFVTAANAFRDESPSAILDISRVRSKRGDAKGALTALEEYLRLMEKKGIRPPWAEESLAALRQKAAPKN